MIIPERGELIEALQSAPVVAVLEMLESEGGCPSDLADAIVQGYHDAQAIAAARPVPALESGALEGVPR